MVAKFKKQSTIVGSEQADVEGAAWIGELWWLTVPHGRTVSDFARSVPTGSRLVALSYWLCELRQTRSPESFDDTAQPQFVGVRQAREVDRVHAVTGDLGPFHRVAPVENGVDARR